MTNGERTPFASTMSVSRLFTTCTTTFLAENCVPSDDTWGTVPWNRSHTFFVLLHFQKTSEDDEKGTWTLRALIAPSGGASEYVKMGSGVLGSKRSFADE